MKAIKDDDGFTIEKRRSRRQPGLHIADLDFADDISLINESIAEAENPLHRLELSTQAIGLFLKKRRSICISIQSQIMVNSQLEVLLLKRLMTVNISEPTQALTMTLILGLHKLGLR